MDTPSHFTAILQRETTFVTSYLYLWARKPIQETGAFLIWKLPSINPIALRKAKIVYNFGLSECNRVKKEGKNETSVILLPKSIHSP